MNFHKSFCSCLVATVTLLFLSIVLSPSVVVRSEPRIFKYRSMKQPQRVPVFSHTNVNYPIQVKVNYKPINYHIPNSFIMAKKSEIDFHRFVQEREKKAKSLHRNIEVTPDPDASPITNESESWKHWNDWKVLYIVMTSLCILFCLSCCCKPSPKNKKPSQEVPTEISTDFDLPFVEAPSPEKQEQFLGVNVYSSGDFPLFTWNSTGTGSGERRVSV